MSAAISSIRDAIRCYEEETDPRWLSRWAEKIRAVGRDCPEAAPWRDAFEICVAYNAEQERAAAAWLEEHREEQRSPHEERREAMRVAIISAFNGRELEADGFVPKWLRRSWDGTGPAGGARTRLGRELA